MKKSIFFLLCLTAASLHAIIRPAPGQFAVQAEYLYWHPLFDQSYFVFRDTPPVALNRPNGQRLNNQTKWHSGFRVEALYEMCDCCNELDVRWTRMHTKSRQRFNSALSNLVPTQGHVGLTSSFNRFAQSQIQTNLDVGEFLFLTLCFCPDIRVHGGLNYSRIGFKETLIYTGGDAVFPRDVNITQRDTFWGLGPEVTLDFDYPLKNLIPFCSCIPIRIHGDVRGSLLVSKSRSSFFERSTQPSFSGIAIDAHNSAVWRIVPVWDIRFGLASQYNCGCANISLEVGYELLSYSRALHTTVYYTGTLEGNVLNVTSSFDNYGNLDFHGPYVSVGVSF